MKGNKKLLIVAVLLLLVAVSYTTYAIYRSALTANATISAAKWSAVLDNGTTTSTTTLNFTGADLNCGSGTRHGKNNTVAPGDACTLTFTVDLDGSEVDAKVNATVGTITATSGTVDSTRFSTALKVGATAANGVEQAVPYSATEGAMEVEYTLELTWLGDTDNLAADGKDVADVAMNDLDITIPVTIDAHQDMGA